MKIINFYKYLDKLKRTKRKGWVDAKIPDSESVSDHSFSTAVLSMILGPKFKVNTEKLIKMALIHDIGESITGDITWFSKAHGVNKEVLIKKEKNERMVMKKILSTLKNNEYLDLWKEMDEMKTKEAKLHKEIDRLDMTLQAYYNEKRTKINLDGFFHFADLFIKDKNIKKILDKIKILRNR